MAVDAVADFLGTRVNKVLATKRWRGQGGTEVETWFNTLVKQSPMEFEGTPRTFLWSDWQ